MKPVPETLCVQARRKNKGGNRSNKASFRVHPNLCLVVNRDLATMCKMVWISCKKLDSSCPLKD